MVLGENNQIVWCFAIKWLPSLLSCRRFSQHFHLKMVWRVFSGSLLSLPQGQHKYGLINMGSGTELSFSQILSWKCNVDLFPLELEIIIAWRTLRELYEMNNCAVFLAKFNNWLQVAKATTSGLRWRVDRWLPSPSRQISNTDIPKTTWSPAVPLTYCKLTR